MKLFADRLRALGGGRVAIVVGVFLLVALAAGASSVLAGGGLTGMRARGDVPVPRASVSPKKSRYSPSIIVGRSLKNDLSRPLRLMPAKPIRPGAEHEASPNPRPVSRHKDLLDAARQTKRFSPNMPSPTLNFDGIPFPGVNCNCAPPDTNGEVGATQYLQIVNSGFQVFNKTTGASVFGPVDIATVWDSFGGVCENNGAGDPIVLYDQLANRWLISQFAGVSVPTDECVAVTTGVDATGTWNRYDFHLGTDFFDYPHLGVWPDAYYMTMNVFNSAGTAFLGPQPFAFDRDAMLAGDPATFVTTRAAAVFSPTNDAMLPGDLDGSTLPPANAPDPFLMSGEAATWKLWRFHVDFGTPANSTFTLGGNLTPAGYTEICPGIRNCVPQSGNVVADRLDALGDRGMFRLAYRNFGGHEALVGNQTVSSGGVAGIRWYEINNATSGTPAFAQQSTYQPDTTWRWMGSAAMDRDGDLALGFSASDGTINPQIRYAGRLAGDPVNTLPQGEAHLFDGTGHQTATNNRWGDYSDLTVDPIDDCTFWYTQEYYAVTGQFNWRTRIGNFKFPSCSAPAGASLSIDKTADAGLVEPGSQVGFNVTLTNTGADPATGIVVTDNLPAGAGIDWSIDAAHSDAGWSVAGSPPSETLVGPATLAGTTASHVHVVSNTTSGMCGALDNTADVTSTNGGGDSANASTTLNCLAVTKVADAAGVTGGSQIGYTVTVTNNAPGPVSNLSVTDHLPAGTGINWSIDAAGSSAGWSISGSAPNQNLVAPANLPAGQSTHVHVVSGTTANSGGTYENTVTATSSVGSAAASASTSVSTCSLSQGFGDVSNLPGWFMQNNSDPLGGVDWFQGDPGAFPAQAGAANSYIAADFENVDLQGTISNWLLTPVLTLKNGTQLTFWTRKITETGPFYPDRLQVRMSTSGASTDVGSTATGVGVFTRLLLDINPTYSTSGYPMAWTKYTLTLSGVTGTTSGRIAFRYFVEDGGFFGARSNYVGIDTAAYTCTPPPPPPPPAPPPPPPPPPHSLAVVKTGTGSGTVTSSPAGVNCGATCVATFPGGTNVTLTATPATGSRFAGWSSDCAGTSRTCLLTMTVDRMAVATFAKVIRCKVPKLVGLTLKKARTRIVRAHCRVGKITKKFSTRKKKGRVLSQKPRPGKLLAAGARVSLVVGKGPRR
jgi:uncharacterized repeat protein (TIGR01451 family)